MYIIFMQRNVLNCHPSAILNRLDFGVTGVTGVGRWKCDIHVVQGDKLRMKISKRKRVTNLHLMATCRNGNYSALYGHISYGSLSSSSYMATCTILMAIIMS